MSDKISFYGDNKARITRAAKNIRAQQTALKSARFSVSSKTELTELAWNASCSVFSYLPSPSIHKKLRGELRVCASVVGFISFREKRRNSNMTRLLQTTNFSLRWSYYLEDLEMFLLVKIYLH